jgi:hypothetical protein
VQHRGGTISGLRLGLWVLRGYRFLSITKDIRGFSSRIPRKERHLQLVVLPVELERMAMELDVLEMLANRLDQFEEQGRARQEIPKSDVATPPPCAEGGGLVGAVAAGFMAIPRLDAWSRGVPAPFTPQPSAQGGRLRVNSQQQARARPLRIGQPTPPLLFHSTPRRHPAPGNAHPAGA